MREEMSEQAFHFYRKRLCTNYNCFVAFRCVGEFISLDLFYFEMLEMKCVND